MISSPLHSTLNRGKRSICIDLRQPSGVAAFLKLAERADVILQNFRPGVVERMGIDYEACSANNRGLVYMSISGFGKVGPYAQKRVYDPVIQAVSGLTAIQADAGGRPSMMRLIVPDKVTALTSAQAISTALVRKYRTGQGAHIHLSMLDAVISFSWAEGFAAETFVMDQESLPPEPEYVRDMVFATADGKYITCGAVQDKEWVGLCNALNRADWIDDPRFATGAARAANKAVRLAAQADEIIKHNSDSILAALDKEGVPSGPVNYPRARVLQDPQVVANNLLFQSEHAHAPFPLRQPRPAAQFVDAPFELRRGAPLLGEHSREVLEQAGLSSSEIDDLFARGVVATVDSRVADPTLTSVNKLRVSSG